MKLGTRLGFNRQAAAPAVAREVPVRAVIASRMSPAERARQEIKLRLHRDLLQRIVSPPGAPRCRACNGRAAHYHPQAGRRADDADDPA
jgi:hypothetical protein